MRKYLYLLSILFVVILVVFLVCFKRSSHTEYQPVNVTENPEQGDAQEEPNTSLANPASEYCEEDGGELEIVTNSDGSQIGLCKFEYYTCEEWTYMNGECTIEEDEAKIKEALIAKDLDLTDMKVVIHKHLGGYIGARVVPVSAPAGGGYVFAVKEDGVIRVLADGNGAIMCSSFEDYPEYPSYLVSECVDESGNLVTR